MAVKKEELPCWTSTPAYQMLKVQPNLKVSLQPVVCLHPTNFLGEATLLKYLIYTIIKFASSYFLTH
jgi:hypothetical protein